MGGWTIATHYSDAEMAGQGSVPWCDIAPHAHPPPNPTHPQPACPLVETLPSPSQPERTHVRLSAPPPPPHPPARVHPGESNASWMMKGVLDFLTGPSLDAKLLRDNFVFKVRQGRGMVGEGGRLL